MKILVTGANGFVGRALCGEAISRGFRIVCATRAALRLEPSMENVVVGTIDANTDWSEALRGINVVIHLAARVHVMSDNSSDPLAEFRRVNTAATVRLARSAAAGGVKRLVYVSSIKVNGESNSIAPSPAPSEHTLAQGERCGRKVGERDSLRVFSESDAPDPQDPYGISKWEAEQALHRVAEETGLEVAIVRPPLVYGAGVKGNFEQMLRVVESGVPLPLGSVRNQRDLIFVGNLVDALLACATHPAAAGKTYLVSDGESVSTPELLQCLAETMGVPSRVFPFPLALLKLAGKLTGKSAQLERLLGSLQVDSGKIRRELNWVPPFTLQEGLQETAQQLRNTKQP